VLAGAGGVLVADLLSGIVHFACDRFFSERTPLIGSAFIAPFREHHRDPAAIARHGFRERNGNSCIAILPLLCAAHLCCDAAPGRPLESLQQVFTLALTAALGLTNEVHALAHRAHAPQLVRRLQRAGVILSPALHARHHQGGHTRAYCITTGWCNPLLDAAATFPRAEALLRRAARALRGRRSR
jgi:plasmanylethanolamine desaturase